MALGGADKFMIFNPGVRLDGVDYTNDTRSVSVSDNIDTPEVTTSGDGIRSFEQGLRTIEGSIEMWSDREPPKRQDTGATQTYTTGSMSGDAALPLDKFLRTQRANRKKVQLHIWDTNFTTSGNTRTLASTASLSNVRHEFDKAIIGNYTPQGGQLGQPHSLGTVPFMVGGGGGYNPADS